MIVDLGIERTAGTDFGVNQTLLRCGCVLETDGETGEILVVASTRHCPYAPHPSTPDELGMKRLLEGFEKDVFGGR